MVVRPGENDASSGIGRGVRIGRGRNRWVLEIRVMTQRVVGEPYLPGVILLMTGRCVIDQKKVAAVGLRRIVLTLCFHTDIINRRRRAKWAKVP